MKSSTLFSGFQNALLYKIVSTVLFFISSTLVFRYFGPELRGEIAILLAPILLSQIALFDGGTKVQDFLSKDIRLASDSNHSSIWSSFFIKATSGVILATILAVSGPEIADYYGLQEKRHIYELASILFLTHFLCGPVDLNVLQALKRYSAMKIFGIIESTGPLFAILACWAADGSVVFYIYMYILMRLILAPYSLFLLAQLGLYRYLSRIRKDEIIKILLFTGPLWFAALLAHASSQIVPLLSGIFFQLATIGNISLALGVGLMAVSIISLADGFALPKLNENRKKNTSADRAHCCYLLRYWQALFYTSALLAIGTFVFSDVLVLIIGGSSYTEAGDILRWLALLVAVKPLGVLRTIIYTGESTSRIASLTAMRFSAEIVLLCLCFKFLGSLGLGIALATAFLVYGSKILILISRLSGLFSPILIRLFCHQLGLAVFLSIMAVLHFYSPSLALISSVAGILFMMIIISAKQRIIKKLLLS
ncbi:MAG: hypothetical protein CMF52_04635 [Legionellales bacterium]|nr:hypothetical protein [Legionellales bacterium]